MAEKRGRGAPPGNRNNAKGMEWLGALNYALNNYQTSQITKGLALRKIGEKVVELALEGNIECIREIGNRLDGKPTEHKIIDKTVAHEFGGLSEAAHILQQFAGSRKVDDSEGAVSH